MTKKDFEELTQYYAHEIEAIKQAAHALHQSVNQTYGHLHPYGFHLDMVAESVWKYGHEVCLEPRDVLPLFLGAFFHDSIEDARQTYHDVVRTARQYMDEEQAHLAAELVYALTNDKGRTREERAGAHYYQGIRETPYAPFLKLADRVANYTYSCQHTDSGNCYMRDVYRKEMPHFLTAITTDTDDIRFRLPKEMTDLLRA